MRGGGTPKAISQRSFGPHPATAPQDGFLIVLEPDAANASSMSSTLVSKLSRVPGPTPHILFELRLFTLSQSAPARTSTSMN